MSGYPTCNTTCNTTCVGNYTCNATCGVTCAGNYTCAGTYTCNTTCSTTCAGNYTCASTCYSLPTCSITCSGSATCSPTCTAPTVTTPNGGESWKVGTAYDITWQTGNGGDVHIALSRDNGATWETLFDSTPNDGTESWTVTGPVTTQALVGISNSYGSDASDANFWVAPAVGPYGTMQLNNGAAATNKLTVTADSTITGATEMRFAAYNGSAWVYSSWQPYAATATVTLYAPDGTKRVNAYYRDAAGNKYSTSDAIILDTVPPSGTMQLNKGAVATNKLTVTANSSVTGATQMRFAAKNGSAWVYSSWQPYAATATVTIYAPDGSKKVVAYYRDAAGNNFSTSDTIVLDTVAPSGWMELDLGSPATNELTVSAHSSVTGATQMRFAAKNGSAWVYTAWQPFAATAPVTIYAPDGSKKVVAYYRDAAGNNFSTSDTIVLDTVAPSGTMVLNDGAATTSSTTVTADSAITGATQMRFAAKNGSAWVYTAWQPFAATAPVTIYPPDGNKSVVAFYYDDAGNLFRTSDTIILSTL